jgi:hypothetical protein
MDHREYTKKDYNLTDRQYDRHCILMDMPMNQWPKGLYDDYVRKDSKKMGFCGEVVVCAVARWVRERY